ncbi:amidohydrolase [Actinomadura sp. NBRC 104412]|uniref:amidohydrolase n=1 Tax=Actinomadura sp. NBRC 104412 TaxID=3032203 RepID=UPI0024A46B2E|nr:amidohydrolase family protein [Actinomadura sp. NBRC 104412]GLZ02585.1 amidohydrolase [Actinomadura sp. NBRC 104412]
MSPGDGHDRKRTEGISRRNVFRAGAGTGAVLAMGGLTAAPAGASPGHGGHDRHGGPGERLRLVNGKIHTMDRGDRVVSSVVIEDGRFTAVGRGGDHGDGVTRTIDLRGRTVIPGIIESHIHSVSLANRPGFHVAAVERAESIADVQEALAARRPGVPSGQWITALGGWHPNQWAERRLPTLAELDDAVPDRPVLLYQNFTGPAVTNSAGKRFFDKVDDGPLPHPDAVKVNVAENGLIATGGFGVPTPATTALYLLRRQQTFDDRLRSSRDMMAYSASMGLTAHSDKVLFPTPGPLHPRQVLSNLDHYRMYDPLLHLHAKGETTIRMEFNFLHNQSDPQLPELRERLRNQFTFFGDDVQWTGGIGEWAAPLSPRDVWFQAQRLVAEAGWRNENAVADLAELTQVVEGWEAVDREFGITGDRYIVHHVPVVTEDLLDRLHALGAGVVMRAFTWITGTPGSGGAPFRTILDHGIKAGIEGDGVHISTLTPWPHLQYAVTGVNALGQLVNDGQQITRREALRAFTRENAWFLRADDRLGSIEKGKPADLVVLDRDYFSVPENEIKRISAVLTIVGGRIVHNTGALKIR